MRHSVGATLLSVTNDLKFVAWSKSPWHLNTARRSSITYIVCGTVILFHGLLHWLLQQTMFDFFIINCYKSNVAGDLEVGGYVEKSM